MFEYFEDIAAAKKLIPNPVVPNKDFLEKDSLYNGYYDVYKKNLGAFNKHGGASIPFVLEQSMRMGVAVFKYAKLQNYNKNNPFLFYGTSSADATHARVLAEDSKGMILTLTDSPNISNKDEFERLLNHKFSFFHLGPFVDITPDFLSNHEVVHFRNGFDYVEENTTFQLYGLNRFEQIAYVKRVLKKME